MLTDDTLRAVRCISESALALVGAMALTFLLSMPFLPTSWELDFRLRPDPEAGARLSWTALEQKLESSGAGEVEVVLSQDGNHLVLDEAEEGPGTAQRVLETLKEAGYQPEPPVRRLQVRMESLADPTVVAAFMTIQSIVFLGIGLFLARRRLHRDPGARRASWLRAASYGLGAGTAALLASLGLGVLLEAIGLPVQEQDWVREILARPGAIAWLAPWMVVAAPVAEEAFFRGYIYRFIRQQAGFPAGLLASSVMFAVIHFNLSGFMVYLVIGCALAWVYEATSHLLAPIVAHVTINALALLSSLSI
jgi:membrane protease YdiL (CAAX protease family)